VTAVDQDPGDGPRRGGEPGPTRVRTVQEYRRIVRHSALYGLGNLATRFVGFALLPLYTRRIDAIEYGILAVITVSTSLLTTLLNTGMTSAIFRHYFREPDARGRDRIIATAFAYLTAISAVSALAVGLARAAVSSLLVGGPEYGRHVGVAAVWTFLEVGLLTPLAVLRAREMSSRFALAATVRLAVNLGLNAYLVAGLGLGIYGVLLGNAIGAGALYAALLPMVLKPLFRGVGRDALRRLLRFGAPLTPAMLGTLALAQINRYFIQHYSGFEAVSAYEIAFKIASFLSIFIVQPFSLAWPAVMWSVERTPGAHRLYAKVLTYTCGLTMGVAALISLFGHELARVLVTAEYTGGLSALPWIVFSFVFSAACFVLNTGVVVAGRTELISVALLVAVGANVGLNILLIPPFGIQGAAIAGIAAYAVMAALIFVFSQRLHPIRFEWGRMAWITVSGVSLTAIGLLAPAGPGPISMAFRAALAAAYALLILNPFFLDPGERAAIARVAARLRRRGGATA
jgi:O-antigen/teichoic acid export membrane protein